MSCKTCNLYLDASYLIKNSLTFDEKILDLLSYADYEIEIFITDLCLIELHDNYLNPACKNLRQNYDKVEIG